MCLPSGSNKNRNQNGRRRTTSANRRHTSDYEHPLSSYYRRSDQGKNQPIQRTLGRYDQRELHQSRYSQRNNSMTPPRNRSQGARDGRPGRFIRPLAVGALGGIGAATAVHALSNRDATSSQESHYIISDDEYDDYDF